MRKLHLTVIFLCLILGLYAFSDANMPNNTADIRTHLKNIACLPTREFSHCLRFTSPISSSAATKNASYSNPIYLAAPGIANPDECFGPLSEKEKKVNHKILCEGPGRTYNFVDLVPVDAARSTLNSLPFDKLLRNFMSGDLRVSLSIMNLFNSFLIAALLALGLITLGGNAARNHAYLILLTLSVPGILTGLGTIRPWGVAFAGFLTLGSTTLKLSGRESLSFLRFTSIILLSVTSIYFIAVRRIEILLSSVGLITLALAALVLAYLFFNIRPNILGLSGIFILILCSGILFNWLVTDGFSTRFFRQLRTGQLELSMTGADALNRSKGFTEDGSLSQRIWYVISAPVYYWIQSSENVLNLSKVSLFLLRSLFLLSFCRIFLVAFSRAGKRTVQILVFAGCAAAVVLLPGLPSGGHVALSYVFPLIVVALLFLLNANPVAGSSSLPLANYLKWSVAIVPSVFLWIRLYDKSTMNSAPWMPHPLIVAAIGSASFTAVAFSLARLTEPEIVKYSFSPVEVV